ncbi:formylglycine-generating enzyme family protein [Paenibacillus ginsengarvi]|uniref:Formylglycine-generating enzyme family protein n=1 Tax=Paenibacillus ginsengarvi TaxID=400777 RepID=A0A3B0CI92_9BACL|nr:formylglycine-generating enzyme family protein [Paenibacillus ginsengarvi]RKN85385.1 formylglycine-generating enzyme family protein [Paenibacillus ginsengarvi]
MIAIPEGEEELRDDRIQKSWRVQLKPFLLAAYPVTAGLYEAVSLRQPHPPFAADCNRPVVNTSWLEAVSFCNAFSQQTGLNPCYTIKDDDETVTCDWKADGYRLPTEAEWQYACKAGSSGYRYGELDKIAWYQDNSGGRLQETGAKQPNAWGLYDMLGNVWEWCWDVYDEQVYGSYRIFRGGSWAEEARGCGATCRRRSHPTFRIDDLGFRLARSVR